MRTGRFFLIASLPSLSCSVIESEAFPAKSPDPIALQKIHPPVPMGELKCRMAKVRDRMYAAGADYVVDTIAELPMLIEDINERMAL